MNGLELYNHPTFRAMSGLIHFAEQQLIKDCGLTLEQARGWIQAWASSASDGIGDGGD